MTTNCISDPQHNYESDCPVLWKMSATSGHRNINFQQKSHAEPTPHPDWRERARGSEGVAWRGLIWYVLVWRRRTGMLVVREVWRKGSVHLAVKYPFPRSENLLIGGDRKPEKEKKKNNGAAYDMYYKNIRIWAPSMMRVNIYMPATLKCKQKSQRCQCQDRPQSQLVSLLTSPRIQSHTSPSQLYS